MYLDTNHQTATCPACKKDSWRSEWESIFTVVTCMWCNAKFKNGKLAKRKDR